ncbi:MAG TPA: hypothetical protein VH592_08620 [Gemmataceae bacterium]|jgi:hypothetical protein
MAARSRGETQAKPRPDAYVGLLGLSLLALIVAILFAYLNWSQISEKPKAVQMAPAGGGGRAAPATPPTPGPGTAPGQPAPGAPQPGAVAPGAPQQNK